MFPHKDIVKLSREFVAVMAHSNPDHGEGEFLVGGEKTRLCNLYDLPSCKTHEDMRAALDRRNLLTGVRATPTHIIYSPDLEELDRTNFMTVGNMVDAIEEAQKKLGKPVRWKEFSKIRQVVADARAYLGKGDFRKALRALKGLDAKGMKGIEEEAAGIEERILEAGREKLAAARTALDAGENGEAAKILRDVTRSFGGTEIAEEAKKLLAEAKEE